MKRGLVWVFCVINRGACVVCLVCVGGAKTKCVAGCNYAHPKPDFYNNNIIGGVLVLLARRWFYLDDAEDLSFFDIVIFFVGASITIVGVLLLLKPSRRRSLDGGASFESVPKPHRDVAGIALIRSESDRV